jgi:hypothetical protein
MYIGGPLSFTHKSTWTLIIYKFHLYKFFLNGVFIFHSPNKKTNKQTQKILLPSRKVLFLWNFLFTHAQKHV